MNDTSAQAPGAWLTLKYRDADAALGYLVRVVGFTQSAVYRGDDGTIEHAGLLWPPGGGLMFGSDAGPRWSGDAGAPGTASAYLATPDAAAVFERVTAAGWRIPRTLQAAVGYDSEEFAFLDPEGNAWSVGTYRGESF